MLVTTLPGINVTGKCVSPSGARLTHPKQGAIVHSAAVNLCPPLTRIHPH